MVGKVVAITGANTGIGRATAEALATMGAKVFACGRNPEKLDAAVDALRTSTGNQHIIPLVADLASLEDVRGLADSIAARTDRLDVLVNNAGVGIDQRTETVDGFELTLAVNHLAPFLLTNELLPLLEASAPARIITVSSANHLLAKTLDVNDLQSRENYSWNSVYARTKLCNILFTRALAGRLEGTGVTANCLHPGVIDSDFGDGGDLHGLNAALFQALKWFLPGPERGARTSIYLASSPEVAGISGEYFVRCKRRKPSKLAEDDALAKALWAASDALIGSVSEHTEEPCSLTG